MKTIVTHGNPDLDAVMSIWVVKRFWSGWKKAKFSFIPAGETYKGLPVDSNPEVLHVDTGLGKCDHHQTRDFTCAAMLCWQKCQISGREKEAVERILEIVCDVDHGRDISWPEAMSDRYLFFLEEILGGLNSIRQDDKEVVEFGLTALDSVLKVTKDKMFAEEILEGPEVIKFKTKWGKGVGVVTSNEAILVVGEKMGYSLVVKKDKKRGDVRIYSRWDRGVDLTNVYHQLKALDPKATWFLHSSRCLLLNGSSRNPKMKPTELSLERIIEILKN